MSCTPSSSLCCSRVTPHVDVLVFVQFLCQVLQRAPCSVFLPLPRPTTCFPLQLRESNKRPRSSQPLHLLGKVVHPLQVIDAFESEISLSLNDQLVHFGVHLIKNSIICRAIDFHTCEGTVLCWMFVIVANCYVCQPCGIRFSSMSTLEAHQTYYCSHRPSALAAAAALQSANARPSSPSASLPSGEYVPACFCYEVSFRSYSFY